MICVYIGLGSNLQNPHQQLQKSVDAIAALPSSRLEAVSQVYRSAAIGPGEQPDYLNAVVRLATKLPAESLLQKLQEIEDSQGRVREQHWGPRTLDLDILLYGDRTQNDPHLTLPHRYLTQRNFVLYPLADVCEQKSVLPDGVDLATLLRHCPRGDLQLTGLTLGAGR
ncbi:MAG: 2-amino-4-hydroxy-6-hydroxymethyldihydropteridine diphosphokinase [Pseudomonadota bacterium]